LHLVFSILPNIIN